MPVRTAALIEPLAVAVHAVRRSRLTGGETVAVFGAGPIGILTALVAQHYGARRILVVEPGDDRRALAETLGFETLPATDDAAEAIRAAIPGGARIVFDSAAHPRSPGSCRVRPRCGARSCWSASTRNRSSSTCRR